MGKRSWEIDRAEISKDFRKLPQTGGTSEKELEADTLFRSVGELCTAKRADVLTSEME